MHCFTTCEKVFGDCVNDGLIESLGTQNYSMEAYS